MNSRFDKFVETQLNIYYGQNVYGTIDYEDKDLKEQYENLLQDFKKNLNISYLIDRDEQVLDYIVDNECINEEDVPEFIIFAKVILERLYTIIETYKTTEKKVSIELTKKGIKEREQEARRLVREQKEQERLAEKLELKRLKEQKELQKREEILAEKTHNKMLKEQKELEKKEERLAEKTETKMLKEQKEHEKKQEKLDQKIQKEKERIDNKEYNLQIVECNCGIQIARMNLKNHEFGRDHQLRIEGMCWLIKKYNLDIDV